VNFDNALSMTETVKVRMIGAVEPADPAGVIGGLDDEDR